MGLMQIQIELNEAMQSLSRGLAQLDIERTSEARNRPSDAEIKLAQLYAAIGVDDHQIAMRAAETIAARVMAGNLAYKEFYVCVPVLDPRNAPAECISALSQVMDKYVTLLTAQEQSAAAEWFRSNYSDRE